MGLQKFCLRYSLPLQFCGAAMAVPDEDLGCSFNGALKPLAAERQDADAIRKNDKGCSRYETADEGRVVSDQRVLNRRSELKDQQIKWSQLADVLLSY